MQAYEREIGGLSFQEKVRFYGGDFELLFGDLEERIGWREEELLAKRREIQRIYPSPSPQGKRIPGYSIHTA
jgi:hypothetical protein